jgi:hypothetical protein
MLRVQHIMTGAVLDSFHQCKTCPESVYNAYGIELDNDSVIMCSRIVDKELKGDHRDLELINGM